MTGSPVTRRRTAGAHAHELCSFGTAVTHATRQAAQHIELGSDNYGGKEHSRASPGLFSELPELEVSLKTPHPVTTQG